MNELEWIKLSMYEVIGADKEKKIRFNTVLHYYIILFIPKTYFVGIDLFGSSNSRYVKIERERNYILYILDVSYFGRYIDITHLPT